MNIYMNIRDTLQLIVVTSRKLVADNKSLEAKYKEMRRDCRCKHVQPVLW